MKKLFLSIVSCMCVLAMSLGCVLVSASTPDGVELPNGGKVENLGVPAAYGMTTLGEYGRAEIQCRITCTNGGVLSVDSVKATIKSNIPEGFKLTTTMSIYYTTTDGSEHITENFPGQTTMGKDGYSTTLKAPNRYGNKGTVGYYIQYEKYGHFTCGLTDEF